MRIKLSDSNPTLRRQICRLCGSRGYNRIDILENVAKVGNSIPDPNELSEKIFRCVGVRIERNDRLTKKICRKCFENINKYDGLRELFTNAHVQVRILMGLTIGDGENTADVVADRCNTEPNADNDIQNARCSISIETETDQRTELQRDLSTATIQPDLYTKRIQTSNYCEISNISRMGQQQYSSSIEACRIANSRYQFNALNDLPVICISSSEEDELESTVEIARKGKRKRTKRKAFKANGRFRIVCGYLNCQEMLENSYAERRHMENYHRKGIKKTMICYLCNRTSKFLWILRDHFNSVHSRHKIYRCTVPSCSKIFSARRNRQRHIASVHIKDKAYQYPKCPHKTYFQSNFKKHLRSVHCGESRTAAAHANRRVPRIR